jgi:serine/threonine protein kinase
METIVGKEIDNYQILSVLGKGGMGIVYKARDLSLDRDVAIKMMDATLTREETFLKRFQSEARALAKLQNPNIVSVFALRESSYGFCIVMEFVEGDTLSDRIREHGALPVDVVINIFKQLLLAVDHAHNAGIIHRDLKPGNVMLTRENIVKVTDFGLAKIQAASAVTVTMGTGGTLFYMSPEQVKGLANVDARGDIYSIGMTLYEALAGRIPFSSQDTDFSIRQAIVEGKIPSPEKLNPNIPRELVRIIQKSIERDPKKRYQTAAEMREALEEYEHTLGPETSLAGPVRGRSARSLPPVRKSRYRPLIVSLIAIVLVLAGIVVFRQLTPAEGTLSVATQPGDAFISLNGKEIGRAPVDYHLEPGPVAIRVQKENYLPRDTTVTIRADEILPLTIRLTEMPKRARQGENTVEEKPVSTNVPTEKEPERKTNTGPVEPVIRKGTLFLQARPSGSILIDGVLRTSSAGSGKALEVEAGKRTITFEHPRYGHKTQVVSVNPGERKTFTCYFERSVSVNAVPWGVIVIDGKDTEFTTPKELVLGPGRHRIKVTKTGYETVGGEQEVNIEATISSSGAPPAKIPVSFQLKEK